MKKLTGLKGEKMYRLIHKTYLSGMDVKTFPGGAVYRFWLNSQNQKVHQLFIRTLSCSNSVFDTREIPDDVIQLLAS